MNLLPLIRARQLANENSSGPKGSSLAFDEAKTGKRTFEHCICIVIRSSVFILCHPTFRVQTFARNRALNFNAGNRLVTNCTSIIAQINVRIDKQHCPKCVERNKDYVELLVIHLTEKMAMWLRQCQNLFAFVYPPKSIRYRPLFTTNALFIKKTDVDFSSIYKEAQSNRWINKTNAIRRKWTIQWITQKLLKHCAGR